MKIGKKSSRTCSFCQRDESDANVLIAGPGGVHICDACVNLCNRMVENQSAFPQRKNMAKVADIVIINPRFEVSYWGLEHAMPLLGKKANMPVASLPLLAALTPPQFQVTLIDENVEPLDFDQLAKADIVALTGMNVQRFRMREILTELKARGAFTVVGGPWVTVYENYFGDLADVVFIGEAEETWPQFIQEWEESHYQKRYEQAKMTDMTTVPTPRYHLLKMNEYMFGSLQFSRGCPFQCEFCDIIVTFGRRPRLKTSAQVIAELEALRAQGISVAFVVDDNLIGNKKAIKELLRDVIAWQRTWGYPFSFFTEASLNLAEDPELLQLMVDANFLSVFIGIESPNEAALRETKKYQNVKEGTTVLDRVHTIQETGLEVWCGMIVGFDTDDSTVFDAQREFLAQAGIPQAMVGMLTAIPKTPLYDRLTCEDRIDPTDESPFGTNVIPLRMSRQELRDGYVRLMNELYEPEAYFGRMENMFLRQQVPYSIIRNGQMRPRNVRLKLGAKELISSLTIFIRLMRYVPDTHLRWEYCKRIGRLLSLGREPTFILLYTLKCVLHFHIYTMVKQMTNGHGRLINPF